MANLFARVAQEKKQLPLPIVTPEVIVDGSIVTLKLDVNKLAELAVERPGERKNPDGTVVAYTKNPAFMMALKAQNIEVIQRGEDGLDRIFTVTLNFGRAGQGVYCNLSQPELIETVTADAPPLQA